MTLPLNLHDFNHMQRWYFEIYIGYNKILTLSSRLILMVYVFAYNQAFNLIRIMTVRIKW
jgi:hypothetical protein